MNKVDVLIEGYADVTATGWVASGTTTLITTDAGKHILVDPGANREALLQALEKRALSVSDIDYVFLSHLHLDHSLLMGIFLNAEVITFEAITKGDEGVLVPSLIPDTDVSILKTPGHEYAGASLLVPTEQGTVGVVGDVFWFEGNDQVLDIEKSDDFATNMDELVASRKEVVKLADWIVPGHGKMMKVEK